MRRIEFLCCVVVIPICFLFLVWIPMTSNGLGTSPDFVQFYAAGKVVLEGHALQFYTLAPNSDVLRQFTHPPYEALLFSQIARLPYNAALRVWTLISFSLIGLVFYLLRTYGRQFELWERLLFLAVAFFPVFSVLLQGQDTLWIILALVLAFLDLKAKRHFTSGCWLGIAWIRPHVVLPLLMLLAFRGYWREITGALTVGLVLAALCVAFFGPAVLIQYPATLLHMNGHGNALAFNLYPETMVNLRGIVALAFGEQLFLTLGLSAIVLLWAVRQRIQSEDLFFSLAVVVAMLVSFHLLIYDLSLLILPALLLLNSSRLQEPISDRIYSAAPLGAIFLILLVVQVTEYRRFSVVVPALIWLASRLR